MSNPVESPKEEPLRRKAFRDWRGVVTQSARNAIPENAWFHLENLQPIGPANAQTINDISLLLKDYSTDTIYWSRELNISGTDYIISFATNGKVFAFDIGTGVSSQINAPATLLSGTGSRMDQWKNQILLIIDSSGYYYWDGATFAKITGGGAPSAGTDIAVGFGRVWIVQNRTIFFTGADGFSNGAPAIPDATNYWAVANGAGFVTLTDPTLKSAVTRLFFADSFLYFFGDSCIGAISDVYVPSGAVPPTPVFSNIFIQSRLGSDRPGSIFTFNRMLIFANKTGVWAVQGVQAERISADIDGTWQYADFSAPSFGGNISVNNISTIAMLMKRNNDPIFGSNTILCMFFDGKWWFANFGVVTILVPVMRSGVETMYGFIGNKLYQLFSRTDQSPASDWRTALWPMEDPIQDKMAVRSGFEVTLRSILQDFDANVDTMNASFPFLNSASVGLVTWANNASQLVGWTNNLLQIVAWFTGQFLLYNGSSPAGAAKYIGISCTVTAQYQLSGVYMDYKLGAKW